MDYTFCGTVYSCPALIDKPVALSIIDLRFLKGISKLVGQQKIPLNKVNEGNFVTGVTS